ncbi:restriction endonuclease subunit S [Methylococcus capsulatus]|uniref:restriction endonuclease subunit S n=1 Tax=Methylococcus capsulatus TaxID=414 RepID=UPI0002FB1354|nr:restriction endonuclease subunit S [Methylococcus capsulatus]
MKAWPVVPLAEVLRHRKEFITINDTQQYKRCRVQLHAKGILLRDIVSGADIKTKKQQVCRAGEFLVAEIDAKMGGFGLVPAELHGAVVSSHYFLFELDESCLDARYLDHYCRTERFRTQVEAQGSTNYAAIRPADVLGYTIPLPPLAEQQALVARLDALAEKTRQVEAHLEAAERDAERLLRAYIFHPPGEQPAKRPMSELVSQRQPDVIVDRTAQYRFAGVYSFGRGVFPSVVKTGSEFAYERLSTVRAGDFTYPKLMAWEGALGVVPPECDGMVVSPEFPVFSINTDEVLPELLDIYFRTPEVWPELAELSGGTNVRRRRLQPSAFLTYEIPVPSMATQLKLREVFRRTQALKAKHAAIRQANAALLPATLERLFAGSA